MGFLGFFYADGVVNGTLDGAPEGLLLYVGGGTDAGQEAVEGGVVADMALDKGIEDERKEDAEGEHDVELDVGRSTKLAGDIPAEDHKEVKDEDGDGGADM